MNNIFRLLAWLLAAAVTFATVGPASERPQLSILGHLGEHSLAFVLLSIAFALAYPRHRLPAAAITIAMTGLLEFLQLFAPGRHARWEDLAVDATAALAGFIMVAGVASLKLVPQPQEGKRKLARDR
jgi:VanZ family protein